MSSHGTLVQIPMKENRRVTTRTPRLLLVAAACALALAGCGNGPLQAGAAATVGDLRITTTTLDDLVQRSLADPTAQQNVGTDRPGFERVALRRLIDHEVLIRTTAKEKVSVTAGEAQAARTRIADQVGGEQGLRAEALKAGIADKDLDETIRDVALRDALADKLTASIAIPDADLKAAYQQNNADFDKVHSAHILVATNALAQQILKLVTAQPGRFAALAAQYSTDPGSKDKGGDLGFQGRGALDATFEKAIFTNKPGSFVVVKTQFGFHVIHVIEHRVVSFEDARNDLRRGLLGQQRTDIVQQALTVTAKALRIKINPRFGTWDPAALDVVPLELPDPVTSRSPRPGDTPTDTPTAPGAVAP
ncbi:MAG: PpiC-type peptidyl-prolyl cis-trans isomerase [Frankiales bacterium]|nr:PpiC-type peptidyl-prolyl cis-trans isomerase [Frankiales bacterium]